jgi:hypothetical protein
MLPVLQANNPRLPAAGGRASHSASSLDPIPNALALPLYGGRGHYLCAADLGWVDICGAVVSEAGAQ